MKMKIAYDIMPLGKRCDYRLHPSVILPWVAIITTMAAATVSICRETGERTILKQRGSRCFLSLWHNAEIETEMYSLIVYILKKKIYQ